MSARAARTKVDMARVASCGWAPWRARYPLGPHRSWREPLDYAVFRLDRGPRSRSESRSPARAPPVGWLGWSLPLPERTTHPVRLHSDSALGTTTRQGRARPQSSLLAQSLRETT